MGEMKFKGSGMFNKELKTKRIKVQKVVGYLVGSYVSIFPLIA